MKTIAYNIFLFYLLALGLCSTSCSSSKQLSTDPSLEISLIKEVLKFKTLFDYRNSLNIEAHNTDTKALDISKLTFILDQTDGNTSKAYSLAELGLVTTIAPNATATMEISLEEKIKNDFGGAEGKYNIMIAYDSTKAIDNTDDRSIYYVRYSYPRD